MESNNYIRKIDELGRIVIPKEVRNKLKIQDNENILISIEDKKINISKYSYLNNYYRFISELCNQITEIYKYQIVVEDLNNTIFSNYQNTYSNSYTEHIIKDSMIVGKISIYSSEKESLVNITRFFSRIISTFINYI